MHSVNDARGVFTAPAFVSMTAGGTLYGVAAIFAPALQLELGENARASFVP